MMFYKILLAIGKDKPGIVDSVSEFLSKRNCNIEDSRMSVIGKEFALFLLFSGPAKSIEDIRNDIKQLENEIGLITLLKDTTVPENKHKEAVVPYKLEAVGMDNLGIVNEITHTLHKHNINIEDLASGISHAPVSGTELFHLNIKMSIPAGAPISKIKEELLKIESRLNLNIDISPVKDLL